MHCTPSNSLLLLLALCTKSSVTNIVTRIYFVISRKCNNARDKGFNFYFDFTENDYGNLEF